MVNFRIDPSELAKLNRELGRYSAATSKSLKDVVKSEARLLAVDLVNFTPPLLAKSKNEFRRAAPQEQRQQGEKAVAMDINRMFQPLDSIDVIRNSRTKRLTNAFTQLLDAKQYKAVGELLWQMGVLPFKAAILETVDKALHRKFRTARGRVGKRVKNPWLVMDAQSIPKYIKAQQKKVGRAKSGWAATLRGLGLSVPGWINKGGAGSFSVKDTSLSVEYTMQNSVNYAQKHYDNIVTRAIRKRVNALIIKTQYAIDRAIKNPF
jgi:hypothetical protein